MKTFRHGRPYLRVIAGAFASVAASPACAQIDSKDDQPPIQAMATHWAAASEAASHEQPIIATGSRIARTDSSAPAPLIIVQDEELRLSGAGNVEFLLNKLPQFVPDLDAFFNNGGDGTVRLNLRGLGASRTLTLVDGRRWIPSDTTELVDINTIPTFLLDSVEILTGGGSAVYGPGAIAGVVNFRPRRDIDGWIAGGYGALTEHGDGKRAGAHIAYGSEFGEGRGRITLFAEYYDRTAISKGDRALTRVSLTDDPVTGELIPAGSASVPEGRFSAANAVFAGGAVLPIAAGTNYSGAGAFFSTPGASRPFNVDTDLYNFHPPNFLWVPQERSVFGGFIEYDLTPNAEVYGDFHFIENRTAERLAPTPLFTRIDIDLAAVQPLLSAPDFTQLQLIAARQQAANAAAEAVGEPLPFNHFTIGTTPQFGVPLPAGFVRLNVFARPVQVGDREFLNDREAWRGILGLTGTIGGSLTYDVSYLFARTDTATILEGDFSLSRFNTAVAGGVCNIFGADQLSLACQDEIALKPRDSESARLEVAQASLRGAPFTLPWAQDAASVVVGVEWRSLEGAFNPDEARISGETAGNLADPLAGRHEAREAFAEVALPIVQDGAIHRLALNGGVRYSDYSGSSVKGARSSFAGVELALIRDIAFTLQHQRAIAAPRIGELFASQFTTFPFAPDPCSDFAVDTSDAVRALCIATGVPAPSVFMADVQPFFQIPTRVGGNRGLREETAESLTASVILRPRFLPQLTVAVDYYEIDVANVIDNPNAAQILNGCYLGVQDPDHALCAAISRDPGTGVILEIDARAANVGERSARGVDLTINYELPLDFSLTGSGASRLDLYFLGNRNIRSDITLIADVQETFGCAGRFGLFCGDPRPKSSWLTRLSWIDGPLTTSLRWRHVASVRDDDDFTDYAVERIGAYDLVDLAFAFEVNERLVFTAGVNNLLDRDPPIMGDNQRFDGANTWPGTYDVLGRDFFVSANVRF